MGFYQAEIVAKNQLEESIAIMKKELSDQNNLNDKLKAENKKLSQETNCLGHS